MPLREFVLPADFKTMLDLLPRSFQYPENPEWNFDQDELESMMDSLSGIRRLWPLVRLIQMVTPSLRDVMRGFVWEEDGKPVGLTNVMRMGTTDRWMIANVSVLPEYRRRGIARKLVEASASLARQRGAKSIVLDVIAGNTPAYALYESLGFEHYAGNVQLIHDGGNSVRPVPLPSGYEVQATSPTDWRPRYELAQRITPPAEQKYLPVEAGRFRQPVLLRSLLPLFIRMQGVRPVHFVIRQAGSGQVAATASFVARTRQGGTNRLTMALDPAHAVLAPYLARFLLGECISLAGGRRIESECKHRQEAELAAALDAGFSQRAEYHTMGMIV